MAIIDQIGKTWQPSNSTSASAKSKSSSPQREIVVLTNRHGASKSQSVISGDSTGDSQSIDSASPGDVQTTNSSTTSHSPASSEEDELIIAANAKLSAMSPGW